MPTPIGIAASGVASTAGYTPAVGSALHLWDFSDASKITIVSTKISQLDDKGSGAENLTQGTAGKRPTQGTQNGHTTGVFTAAATTNLVNTSVSVAQPDTIFVVAKTNSNGTNDGFFDGNTTRQAFYQAAGLNIFAGSVVNGGAGDTAWHVWTIVFNGASSEFWRDGVSVASGDAGAATLANIIVGTVLSELLPLDGAMGLLSIYGSVSAGNRQAEEAALKAYWGTP